MQSRELFIIAYRLISNATKTRMSLILDFGKHEGMSLVEVPSSYLEWLAGSSDGWSIERYAQEKVLSLAENPSFCRDAGYDIDDVPERDRADYLMTLLIAGCLVKLPCDSFSVVAWYWVIRERPQVVRQARLIMRSNPVSLSRMDRAKAILRDERFWPDMWASINRCECQWCGRKLVPIGSARANGSHRYEDWSTRRYHKKCYRELKSRDDFDWLIEE
jgi:hypothetical protein